MVEQLIEDQLDIAGFQEDGMPIPTIAFYSPHTLSFIEAALESGDYSLKNVYSKVKSDWLDVHEIGSSDYWYKNINYQQDLIDLHHRSEEHTSELQSRFDLVCRLLLEKKKKK